jgi:hypothetical protein
MAMRMSMIMTLILCNLQVQKPGQSGKSSPVGFFCGGKGTWTDAAIVWMLNVPQKSMVKAWSPW